MIKKFEKDLYDLYDKGVSTKSKYFKEKLKEFVEYVRCNIKNPDREKLLLNLLTKHKLSNVDSKLLIHIVLKGCIIKTSRTKLSKQLKVGGGYLFIRTVDLESLDIIRMQHYDRTKLIYIHPKILRGVNNAKSNTKTKN